MPIRTMTYADLLVAKQKLDGGNVAGFYSDLASFGHKYPALALGVYSGNSPSGVFALAFMEQTAAQSGRNLTGSDIQAVKVGMANGYYEALLTRTGPGNDLLIVSEVTARETWAFHDAVFTANGLPKDAWTLNTPFKLYANDDSKREVFWQNLLEGQSGVVKEMYLGERSYAMVWAIGNFSADPVIKAEAQAWLSRINSPTAAATQIGVIGGSLWDGVRQAVQDGLASMPTPAQMGEAIKQQLRSIGFNISGASLLNPDLLAAGIANEVLGGVNYAGPGADVPAGWESLFAHVKTALEGKDIVGAQVLVKDGTVLLILSNGETIAANAQGEVATLDVDIGNGRIALIASNDFDGQRTSVGVLGGYFVATQTGDGTYDAVAVVAGTAIRFDASVDQASGAIHIDGLTGINGLDLPPDTYALDPQDLEAYGFTYNNLVNDTLPALASDLIIGLDPAAIQSNNWASPQLTVTDLGNGFTQRSIELGNGISLSNVRNAVQELVGTTETRRQPDGTTHSKTYNASNQLISTSNKQVFDDGSSVEIITSPTGVIRRTTDIDGNFDDVAVEGGGANIGQAIGTTIDFLSLVRAIQIGEPLPILVSGLRLANDLSSLSGPANLNLSGAANVGSGILSLLSLNAALERGDTLGAITAGAQAVTFGATAYANFAGYSATQTSSAIAQAGLPSAFAALEKALPYLNIINSIANGDTTGVVVAVADIVLINAGVYAIPYIGWAYAVYSILDSIFSDDDAPEIPDPMGNGSFVWNGSGISFVTTGQTGGDEAVGNVMSGVVATMNALIERERQQNPGSSLGIIPNRMPGVGYDTTGYRYTDIDPLSGGEKHPALRFDTSGRPYNATPGSPESFQSITEGMVRSALGRGAIAPLWEVQTAKLQTDAGDPKAGLTEEERAGRHLRQSYKGSRSISSANEFEWRKIA